ncbi:MAG: HAD family hydrolase [Filifactoraceae bacterium]
MEKNIAAFFDIDGTIYRDSLMLEHFRNLIDYDLIDPNYWYDHARETYDNWDKRQGDYEDYLDEVSISYVKALKGIHKSDIEFTSNHLINKKSDRVYAYTRQIIKTHQKLDHKIIFISGSPDFLVEKMAKRYMATDYLGSAYLYNDAGIFEGKITPMWDRKSKNEAIDHFVEKYNIDLEKSYAYGDTNGDFTMLKRVGNPFAINPARELLTNIQKDEELSKKSFVIIERKDVIYKLKPYEIVTLEV